MALSLPRVTVERSRAPLLPGQDLEAEVLRLAVSLELGPLGGLYALALPFAVWDGARRQRHLVFDVNGAVYATAAALSAALVARRLAGAAWRRTRAKEPK